MSPIEAAKDKLFTRLPPAVSDGLEVNLWGWFSYLRNDSPHNKNIYDAEVSLDVTKSFGQRVAVSGEVNFLDSNGRSRPELEQGYVSALLSEETGTLLTIGKFNANFGVEARDFWFRSTGTTGLLFGAQPQDLLGAMVTQPIGDTGVTLKPFISADFQGAYYFDQPPAGGLVADYRPTKELDLQATNWVGPGFVLGPGNHLRPPYPSGGYGDDATAIFGNWQGPNLTASRGGTLYFLDAKAVWQARPDLTLSGEYLLGTTGTSHSRFGWYGFTALATYDITDHLHAFARYSFLDDSDWIITGTFQRLHEASAGLGYQLCKELELRGEYRHDISSVYGNMDSVSVHLTFGI